MAPACYSCREFGILSLDLPGPSPYGQLAADRASPSIRPPFSRTPEAKTSRTVAAVLPLVAPAPYSTIIAVRVSSRSASAMGLSQRMRWMRGKRMATPDLWRVEGCTLSKATSSTSPGFTSRTGP